MRSRRPPDADCLRSLSRCVPPAATDNMERAGTKQDVPDCPLKAETRVRTPLGLRAKPLGQPSPPLRIRWLAGPRKGHVRNGLGHRTAGNRRTGSAPLAVPRLHAKARDPEGTSRSFSRRVMKFDGCAVRSSSVNLFEHEHRDLPVGLRLVRRVIGPCFDRALPPEPLLVARDLTGDVVAFDRAVLQLDLRVRL